MSRSYKKYARYDIVIGRFRRSYMKQFAVKSIRRYKVFNGVSNGGWYKKLFDSYNIHEGKRVMYSEFKLQNEIIKLIIKAQRDNLKKNKLTRMSRGYINSLPYNDKCYARMYYKWKGK